MSELLLRPARPEDMRGLAELWHQVFGDPMELIEAFQGLLPGLGVSAVAVGDEGPVGAAYGLTAMELVKADGSSIPCGYIYSVAVDPEYRDRGLGAGLSRLAAELSRERGAELICTLPAQDSLYPWYEKVLGTERALSRRSVKGPAVKGRPWREVPGRDYGLMREELLKGREHQRLLPPALDFAQVFFTTFGGGLYTDGAGIAAAYGDGDLLQVRELIAPPGEDLETKAAALAHSLGRTSYALDLPGAEGRAYLAAEPGTIGRDCFWGLCFD